MTAASPAAGRRIGRDRGGFALALLALAGLAGLGFALVRALPTRSDLLDAVGDPAPDLAGVAGALSAAATEARVDRALIFALAAVESAGNPKARSRAGAVGLLQLEEATAGEVGRQLGLAPGALDLEDPVLNARLGARYLARLLVDFAGDETLALAAYNAGPSNVRRWLARAADADARTVIEREGFAETRRHVDRVLRFKAIYAAR